MAKGSDWQIEVVETVRGKELRGIIGELVDDQKGSKKIAPGKKKGKGDDVGHREKAELDSDDEQNSEMPVDDDDEVEEGSDEVYKEEL